MKLDDSAAFDRDGERDSEFLGVTAVYARVETGTFHNGESCEDTRVKTETFRAGGGELRNVRLPWQS